MLLTESHGLIHATTLKWNLYREGRLNFTSNLRLFTNCRLSVPDWWSCNVPDSIFLIVAYSSTLFVFNSGGSRDSLHATYPDFYPNPDVCKFTQTGYICLLFRSRLWGGFFWTRSSCRLSILHKSSCSCWTTFKTNCVLGIASELTHYIL